jgi:short-subunit dehydrogenase
MKDRTVVITGATSGLGRATAHQLAQKGAFVVIIARSKTKAHELSISPQQCIKVQFSGMILIIKKRLTIVL